MIKKFYVVGNPVKKSLSPIIFNYWFKKYKIKHRYQKITINQKSFEKDFSILIKNKNFGGANITTPFKNRVTKIIDKKTKHASIIGAINCVYKKKGVCVGTNTDWEGYLNSLNHQNKISKNNKKIAAIIGYGGAAKALVYALKKKGFKKIIIFTRKKIYPDAFFNKDKNIVFEKTININKRSKDFDILINATTTSSPGELRVNLKNVKKSCVISDINYRPQKTMLILEAQKYNLDVNYGIYMLIFQAAPSFKHWFGFVPKVDKGLIEKCKKNAQI